MTEDITSAVLRQIREDIAHLGERFASEFADVRTEFTSEFTDVRAEISDLRTEVRTGFAHTNEQLGAVVALMGRLAKSDEHLEARIDALEARLVEPTP